MAPKVYKLLKGGAEQRPRRDLADRPKIEIGSAAGGAARCRSRARIVAVEIPQCDDLRLLGKARAANHERSQGETGIAESILHVG